MNEHVAPASLAEKAEGLSVAQKFGWLTAVSKDRTLSAYAFHVGYRVVEGHLNKEPDSWAWMAIGTLADYLGLSTKTVQRALAELVAKGYLEKRDNNKQDGKTNGYRIPASLLNSLALEIAATRERSRKKHSPPQDQSVPPPRTSESFPSGQNSPSQQDQSAHPPRTDESYKPYNINPSIEPGEREPLTGEPHFTHWPTASQSKYAGDVAKLEKIIAEIFESEGSELPSDTGFLKVWLRQYPLETIIDAIQMKMPKAKKMPLSYFKDAIFDEHERKSKPDRPVPFQAGPIIDIPF